MGISEERKEKRRKEILKAATALFVKKGYDATSFNEIAVKSRASKETLYAWFGGKAEILIAIFQDRYDSIVSSLAPEVGSGKPEHVLYLFSRELLRISVDPTISALFAAVIAAARENKAAREMIAGTPANNPILNYLQLCNGIGWLKIDDPDKALSVLSSLARGEYPIWLATGRIKSLSDEEIENHARYVVRIFMKAYAPN